MKIIENGNKIEIYTPYNPDFVSMIKKKIGGAKWSSSKKCWLAPIESTDSVRKIMLSVYGESDNTSQVYVDIRVEFTVGDYSERSPYTIFGRILASASGRDSGARLGEKVELVKGKIGSGGSSKYWRTEINEGSVFIMRKVPKNLVDDWNSDDWNSDDILVSIIEDSVPNKDALLAERERLLARVEEINNIIGGL